MKKILFLFALISLLLLSSCTNAASITENSSTLSSNNSVQKDSGIHFLIKTHETTLYDKDIEAEENTSVYALLKKVCKENDFALDCSFTFNIAYIKGIAGLKEKQITAGSGWIYKVNGVKPSVNANAYKLKNGDTVEWIYSLYYGRDA